MISLRLSTDPFGHLVLTLPTGQMHVGVVPVRSFPFSAPTEWISFCDKHGHEVYCLADVALLDPDTRAALEAELARREFIPVIQTIHSVSAGAEPTDWHVTTDRGESRFSLTSEDHIRRMGPNAALIADSHGIRYLIRDLTGLDARSRKVLRRYL